MEIRTETWKKERWIRAVSHFCARLMGSVRGFRIDDLYWGKKVFVAIFYFYVDLVRKNTFI